MDGHLILRRSPAAGHLDPIVSPCQLLSPCAVKRGSSERHESGRVAPTGNTSREVPISAGRCPVPAAAAGGATEGSRGVPWTGWGMADGGMEGGGKWYNSGYCGGYNSRLVDKW